MPTIEPESAMPKRSVHMRNYAIALSLPTMHGSSMDAMSGCPNQ